MKRLTTYLSRLFLTDAAVLFGVACFLIWLVQCLRAFDVVSLKGQNIGTLALQGVLTMPPLALVFMYACVGIGMARALQALQASHELHIIHSSYGLGSLVRASAITATAGALLALLLSNVLEPAAQRQFNYLQASITADLVSSTLQPQRFTQITPGVVLLIGGRQGNGEITDFFADDRRDPARRLTYIAKSATIAEDSVGYVLQLRDGSLQSQEGARFSEVSFARYDVSVDRLTQPTLSFDPLQQMDTFDLVTERIRTGEWRKDAPERIAMRMSEAVRVFGIVALVLGVWGFPSGKRPRYNMPVELVVLMATFAERGVSAYIPLGPVWGPISGSIILIIIGVVAFAAKSAGAKSVPDRVHMANRGYAA